MTRKEKKLLVRIIVSGILFGISILLSHLAVFNIDKLSGRLLEFSFFLTTYIIIGYNVVIKALKNIIRGHVFDENFLMTIATIGAFFLTEYPEAVAVMLFYQAGEFFQSYAVSKSRKSIASLMDIRPDYANLLVNAETKIVDPEEVHIDDVIIIKPGERIPLDGIIQEGSSSIDTSALTGESMPKDASINDNVISGCINLTGKLTVKVTKEFGESTVSKILDLVENSANKKAKSENFITKFARYYTPVIVIIAVILAVLPPLIIGNGFDEWISRALSFIVISCPCALVISVPLSFFGGIGGASKVGVLVKGSNYLEALAKTKIVVFDKTGTLTKGNFIVTEVYSRGFTENELLKFACLAEESSNHPIALSIKKAYLESKQNTIDTSKISKVEEIAGYGMKANIEDKIVLVGNNKLMNSMNINYIEASSLGTIIYLAVDNEYAGYIRIEDEIKFDSLKAIKDLKTIGINKTIMLTGDNDNVGRNVAKKLELDQVHTELLPQDKVEKIEELMKEKSNNQMLTFVGDGINDAPVLALADIGIAMGGLGSDAAIEAADIVIMTDEPSKIATAIKISKRTLGIVRQNIIFALAVKCIILILGALGYASMWAAVFADVGVSVIAILNAIRALNVNKFNKNSVK